jgi:hypothetical protein
MILLTKVYSYMYIRYNEQIKKCPLDNMELNLDYLIISTNMIHTYIHTHVHPLDCIAKQVVLSALIIV